MRKTGKQAAKPRVIASVRSGQTIEQASRSAGVSPSTVSQWRKRDRVFDAQLRKACRPTKNTGDIVRGIEQAFSAAGGDSNAALNQLDRQTNTDRFVDNLYEQTQEWYEAAGQMSEQNSGDMWGLAEEMGRIADEYAGAEQISTKQATLLADEWRDYYAKCVAKWSRTSEGTAQDNKLADEYRTLGHAARKLATHYDDLSWP